MTLMTAHCMWTDRSRNGMPVFVDFLAKAYGDARSPFPGGTWIQPTSRVAQRT